MSRSHGVSSGLRSVPKTGPERPETRDSPRYSGVNVQVHRAWGGWVGLTGVMRFLNVDTNVQISRIGLGTWQFGSRDWGYGPSYAEQEAHAIVRRALELGVTLFDTAELYGFGRSERILGQALGEARESAFLATKIFPILPVAPVVEQRAVASANRLGVRRLDLYQVHQPNPLVRDGTIMRGMRALQRAHAAHDRPVPDQRIGLVHLVQVEPADPEPVRAGHRALLHHRGDRQDREDLRGQEGRLPGLAQGLAQDPLAAAETVELGRVEQGHAQLQGPAHDGVCLLLGVGRPVAPVPGAELPGAQPDPGNLHISVDVQKPHDSSQADPPAPSTVNLDVHPAVAW